jgi:hypothetical protein
VKYLSKALNIQDSEQFLVHESLTQQIKALVLFLATIIPVAVAIIQILLPKSTP